MLTKRYKVLSLLGIPIYLHISWFIVFALLTWDLASVFPQLYGPSNPVSSSSIRPAALPYAAILFGMFGALALFTSILLHELAHCLVARLYKVPIRGITLFIFGGVAEMGDEAPSPEGEFFVAIAGPVLSILLALASVVVWIGGEFVLAPPPVIALAQLLAKINGMLVLFNMIPAFPLDGGRVLRSIVWHLKGDLLWATRITARIGSAFGIFLIALGVFTLVSNYQPLIGPSGLWALFIGFFLHNAANMSYTQVAIRAALQGERVGRFMVAAPATVRRAISVEDLVVNHLERDPHRMYPVIDEHDRLLGCVTIARVKQVPREDWNRVTVGEIVIPLSDDNTVDPAAEALFALTKMSRGGLSRLLVVRDGQLAGLLTMQDMLTQLSLRKDLNQTT